MAGEILVEDVDRFLKDTRFSGYQSVPLPYGKRVPGRDRMRTADLVFREGIQGKSVVDIGTYYGFFPYEAIHRGAHYAIGIEMDPERYDIARQIAELNGGRYEIAHVSAEEFRPSRKADIVLALNVLHHVLDPVAFISHLATLCSDTLIIEFRLPEDPQYIEWMLSKGRRPGLRHRLLAQVRSRVLHIAGAGLGLMAIGNREYHRVFYFSREAFYNLFVIHLKKFSHVSFERSPERGRAAIAFCRINK